MKKKKRTSNIPQMKNKANYSITAHKSEVYVGPLPKPETLKQFDDIVPGAAERILTQFEEQSRHRRDLEQKVISNDIVLSQRGLTFALVIGVIAIVGGIVTALVGKELAGAFIGGGGVIGLVSAFIYGSQAKRKHLKTKEG